VDNTIILSQWYRESELYTWGYREVFCPLWRHALELCAPGIPILVCDNGGEVRQPHRGVEVVNLVNPLPHGRGTEGHYSNCWKAIRQLINIAINRNFEVGVFVGQNNLVGVPFIDAVTAGLNTADILCSTGWSTANGCHTEIMAFNLKRCAGLLKKEYAFPLEVSMTGWAGELGLVIAECAELYHKCNWPNLDIDTVTCGRSPLSYQVQFAERHGLLRDE